FLYYIYPPIQKNGGFVDLFIGDAVMALFFHSHDAIKAAIEIHKALNLFNQERIKESAQQIDIGIGLHRGKLMLGIIGVENRLQGSVVSDAVNLASRIESLTKLYGSALL